MAGPADEDESSGGRPEQRLSKAEARARARELAEAEDRARAEAEARPGSEPEEESPEPAEGGGTCPPRPDEAKVAAGRKAMVRLDCLHKRFGPKVVLAGVDLDVYEGETLCLIGGSGSGKSVTLKHVMGLLEPDSGRVIVDDIDVSAATGEELARARLKLGVNFQFGALLRWLTVYENVALPLRENTDMSEAEIERRVMDKLELLHIAGARDNFPDQISGGMQKRAGLARAVVMEDDLKVILYDEPTSGLDPITTARVDEMINEMKERLGLTQIVVTHDMVSAYRIADRIAILNKGKLEQVGTPDEIRNSTVPYVQQFVHGLTAAPAADAGKAPSPGPGRPESTRVLPVESDDDLVVVSEEEPGPDEDDDDDDRTPPHQSSGRFRKLRG